MPAAQVPPGVEGIVRLTELPDDDWRGRWERIIVAPGIKDRLLNYVLFTLRHRGRTSDIGLGIHGLLVLSGPPGTGKTTLAGGLADEAGRSASSTSTRTPSQASSSGRASARSADCSNARSRISRDGAGRSSSSWTRSSRSS